MKVRLVGVSSGFGGPSAEVFYGLLGKASLQPDPGQTNAYACGLQWFPATEPACLPSFCQLLI